MTKQPVNKGETPITFTASMSRANRAKFERMAFDFDFITPNGLNFGKGSGAQLVNWFASIEPGSELYKALKAEVVK